MRYLKQKGTGRVYVYTDILAQRDDMIEVAGPGEPVVEAAPEVRDGPTDQEGGEDVPAKSATFDPESIVIDGEAVAIAEATKAQLADYAETHFGQRPDGRKSRADTEAALRALIEEHGHPDEDV